MYHDLKTLSSVGNMAEAEFGLSQVPQLRAQGRQGQLAELTGAAHEFEAYFISYMLKVMRDTIPKGVFDSKGGAYFYSFYDQEIGRLASKAGGLGLAKMIHQYTEKNVPSLKFSERITDNEVDKDHRPILKNVPG